MVHPMSLTLVSMLSSVAAAVAMPDADVLSQRAQAPRPPAAAAADRRAPARPPGTPWVARAPARLAEPPCGPDAAAPYRQWHHGGLKLVPGCAAALHT